MTTHQALHPDRLFSAEPAQRKLARDLYESIKDLPLICPHGHVSPALLADPDATLGTPAELFVIPDHYVTRMLYSQGVRLESLGVPTKDGTPTDSRDTETDHRKVWRRFAEHFYLFRGTPTGLWLKDELAGVFGIEQTLTAETADAVYDELSEKLAQPEFSPRALFKRFNIEVLCTTDAATDTLDAHRSLHREGWTHIRPTFRPDAVSNLRAEGWRENITKLGEVSGLEVTDYPSFITTLEGRREVFRELGATATDHAALTPPHRAVVGGGSRRHLRTRARRFRHRRGRRPFHCTHAARVRPHECRRRLGHAAPRRQFPQPQ